jgi:hypothetical protein
MATQGLELLCGTNAWQEAEWGTEKQSSKNKDVP